MRAVRMDRPGHLGYLHIEDMVPPVCGDSDVLVRVEAAAINPSDVANVQGKFPHTQFPCTPGRDFAGIVVEGPGEWQGRSVFGSLSHLGFSRMGSHAEMVVVPVHGIIERPPYLSSGQAAAIGVPYTTAWRSVIEIGQLRPGQTLLVIGARGRVASAAAQIGRWAGARVIGITSAPENMDASGFDYLFRRDQAHQIRELTDGWGIDLILDTVGGEQFGDNVELLARGGRVVAIASPASLHVTIPLVDFYHKEAQLFGVDSLKFRDEASKAMLERMLPGFASGALEVSNFSRCTVDDAPEWYRCLQRGDTHQKIVIDFSR